MVRIPVEQDKMLVDKVHGWSEYSEERYNSTTAGIIIAAVSLFFCVYAVLPGGLVTVLELIGLAAVPFWLFAPLLNFVIRFGPEGKTMPFTLLVPLVLSFIWSFVLVKKSMAAGQGLSEGRATLAVACMWIFSVSAIYVFSP
jgi:hypothetical protein